MNIEILKQYAESEKWSEIVQLTKNICSPGYEASAGAYFFRAYASLELKEYRNALNSVEKGVAIAPLSEWGNQLAFQCRLLAGDLDRGFVEYEKFIEHMGEQGDRFKPTLVDEAVKRNRFDLAVRINETRRVIDIHDASARYAVALQCFNKPDTLEKAIDALLLCEGRERFDLVILQDSAIGSKKECEYTLNVQAVRNVLSDRLPLLMEAFCNVSILANRDNLGTAPSCRKLLDHVSKTHDGFLFIEDDCLLSRDALNWALFHLENTVGPYRYWYATCESIYFNAGEKEIPSDDYISRLKSYVDRHSLNDFYVEIDFVPSTCFLTTSTIWDTTRCLRSLVRGPESLTAYMQQFSGKTLSPVVPRAMDVGMQHDAGYSVGMLGKSNVKEHKNTYIHSEGRETGGVISLYKGDKDALYAATVNFDSSTLDRLMLVA